MPIRKLLAVLVLVGGWLVAPQMTAPAAAANVDFEVHEWNICGSVCYGGSVTPANIVIFAVTSQPRPWSVSLNEVCLSSSQHSKILNALDDLGFHSATFLARISAAGCGGAGFGNAVYAVGTPVSSSQYTFPTSVQDPGQNESRGVVCTKSQGFLGVWQACSTHLVNSLYAYLQEDHLFAVSALGGNMLNIVGGDFNIEPIATDLNKWRADYDEIDEIIPWEATHDDGRKLDYIWAHDSGSTSSPFPVVISPIGAPGDHHYYEGKFRLTV
jgi:hypothetical protein